MAHELAELAAKTVRPNPHSHPNPNPNPNPNLHDRPQRTAPLGHELRSARAHMLKSPPKPLGIFDLFSYLTYTLNVTLVGIVGVRKRRFDQRVGAV